MFLLSAGMLILSFIPFFVFVPLIFLLGCVLWSESLSQRSSLCDWYIQHFSVYLWKYHQGRVKETQQGCGSRFLIMFSFACYPMVQSQPRFYLWELLLFAERKRKKEIHITLFKRLVILVILLELFKSYIPCKIQISTWLKWENWKMRKGGVLEKQLKLGQGQRGKLSLSGIPGEEVSQAWW